MSGEVSTASRKAPTAALATPWLLGVLRGRAVAGGASSAGMAVTLAAPADTARGRVRRREGGPAGRR